MFKGSFRSISEFTFTTDWKRIRENGTQTHVLAEKLCNGDKLCTEELEKVKHVSLFLEEHPQFDMSKTTSQRLVECSVSVICIDIDRGF